MISNDDLDPDTHLYNDSRPWTAKDFAAVIGREPTELELALCNCAEASELGHERCGICSHGVPTFFCNICFESYV